MGRFRFGSLVWLLFCTLPPRGATSFSEGEFRNYKPRTSPNAVIDRRSVPTTTEGLNINLDGSTDVDLNPGRLTRRLKRQGEKAVELYPREHKSSLHVTGSTEQCYQAIATEFGLKAVFDSAFERDKVATLTLDDVNFTSAIRALNDVSQAFIVPLTKNIFLVAKDSNAKRTALEPIVTAIISIPAGLTREMIDQLGQALQQVLEIKRLRVDQKNSQIVIRDTAYRVQLAREICRHFSHARAEVVFEVELIAMKKTEQVDFGLKLPTAVPVINTRGTNHKQASKSLGGISFVGLSLSRTILGVSIADAILTANQTKSTGRIIQKFQLRCTDGQPATLNIGERFPIKNAQFSAVVSNAQMRAQKQAGTLRPAFPSVSFEDLGLTFVATPRVHDANTVSIKLEVETQLLSGSFVNEIPILANRSFSSTLRLGTNKSAVITGMQVFERQKNRSGLPWLASLPWIGQFFSVKTQRFNVSDLIITVRPRILRLPQAEIEPSLILRYGPVERPLSAL